MKILKLCFCLLVLAFFTIFVYLLTQDPSGLQANIMHDKGKWFFIDFWGIIAVYACSDMSYGFPSMLPPLAPLVKIPFSFLLSDAEKNSHLIFLTNRFAVFSVVFFLCGGILALFSYLRKLDLSKNYPLLLLAALFFSSMVMFEIANAHDLILSAIAVAIFIVHYDKESKYDRAIAIIALSFTAALKIYPVLLGFLWLYKKRYKDLIYAAMLTVFLLIAPFFALRGEVTKMISIMFNYLTSDYLAREGSPPIHFWYIFYNQFNIVRYFAGFDGLIANAFTKFSGIASAITVLCAIITAGFCREKWKQIVLVAGFFTMLYSAGSFYCGLYFFPAIVLFFNKEKFVKIDILYAFLFAMFLCPIRFGDEYFCYIVNTFSLILVWFIVLITGAYELRHKIIWQKINVGKTILSVIALVFIALIIFTTYLVTCDKTFEKRVEQITALRITYGLELNDKMYDYINPPALFNNREKLNTQTANANIHVLANFNPAIIAPLVPEYAQPANKDFINFANNSGSMRMLSLGLSPQVEEFGRWSDANILPVVKLYFGKYLNGKYKIAIQMCANDGQAGKPAIVNIGGLQTQIITPAEPTTFVFNVDLNGVSNLIEIMPTSPKSPAELEINPNDQRKLGIGLQQIVIEKVIEENAIELPIDTETTTNTHK